MRIPTDDQFSAVPGLQLLGVLGPLLSIAQADGGDGLTWMLAELKTLSTETGEPITITFKTPYPSAIDERWRVADFIAWVISHEMMESVRFDGAPLYDSARLDQDHCSTDVREYMYRLDEVRRRFERDRSERRWLPSWRADMHTVLSDGLGLSIGGRR